MPYFVISYVPEVEHVDEIDIMHQLDNVSSVDLVDRVTLVDTVDYVNHLPKQHFSWRTLNYQYGGSLYIEPIVGTYQAVYIPDHDCDFKGVNLCFTAYNIEDTYDVMVGARYVIKGSHVKEMSEYRELPLNEVVPANTPITIQFTNRSGMSKFMLYDIVTQLDEQIVSTQALNWTFNWLGTDMLLHEQDTMTLVINQPNYVNLQSAIGSLVLTFTDKTNVLNTWTVGISAGGVVSSSYVESNPLYQGLGFLGRVNVIAVTLVQKYSKTIHIVFKNITESGTVNPHMIEMSVAGAVINTINGGI